MIGSAPHSALVIAALALLAAIGALVLGLRHYREWKKRSKQLEDEFRWRQKLLQRTSRGTKEYVEFCVESRVPFIKDVQVKEAGPGQIEVSFALPDWQWGPDMTERAISAIKLVLPDVCPIGIKYTVVRRTT